MTCPHSRAAARWAGRKYSFRLPGTLGPASYSQAPFPPPRVAVSWWGQSTPSLQSSPPDPG